MRSRIQEKLAHIYYFKSDHTKVIVNRIALLCGDFTIIDIKRFILTLEGKKLGTINTTKAYLQSISNKIVALLTPEVYEFIQNYTKTKIKLNAQVINLPTKEQCKNFYAWLFLKDKKTALIFKSVFESGLRISEIKNINLKKSYIKEGFLYLYYISSKGKKEDYIEVGEDLYRDLHSFGDLPFIDIDLTSFSNKLKRRIKAYNKATKSTFPLVSIHKIRHLNATLLLMGGVNLSLVSKRLGHSSPAITSRFYDSSSITHEQLGLLRI